MKFLYAINASKYEYSKCSDCRRCYALPNDHYTVDTRRQLRTASKKNQGKLLKEIKVYFHIAERDFPNALKDNIFQELDGEHGRINAQE